MNDRRKFSDAVSIKSMIMEAEEDLIKVKAVKPNTEKAEFSNHEILIKINIQSLV